MRRALPVLLAVAVAAIVVIGLSQASGGSKDEKLPRFDIGNALASLDGAPPPLAALHAQHNRILDGDLEARLAELRGHPVVINKWGSWCTPCRQEFPVFQRAGADFGRRVAFLGINVADNTGAARRFLADHPVTFPSYSDPRGTLSNAVGAPGGAPITVFIDARGRTAFVHQGPYETVADLRTDIKRYLGA